MSLSIILISIVAITCSVTINYFPLNNTFQGYAVLNATQPGPTTCFQCHLQNGSSNIPNLFVQAGPPSSFVEIFGNVSFDGFVFERGLLEVLTNSIGIGLSNSLRIQCLSNSISPYSPVAFVSLTSKYKNCLHFG